MDFYVGGHYWVNNEFDVPYLVPREYDAHCLNGIEKAIWVERYAEPGEFTIEAKLSSGLLDLCPVSSFISHVDSDDLMIVENHEIIRERDKEPIIKISGRSMMIVYEQRQVGSQTAVLSSTIDPDFYEDLIPADYLTAQIALLIRHHTFGQVYSGTSIDGVYNYGDDMAWNTQDYGGSEDEQVDRVIERGSLLDRVVELLKIQDLGIAFNRRDDTFRVHGGVDRNEVVFSWDNGDFEHLEYLFTNKGYYTAALVYGNKIWVNVNTVPEVGFKGDYFRRTAALDASDIDGFLTTTPTTTQRNQILAKMTTRGQEFIRQQKYTSLSRVEISSNSRWVYRRDYYIGDKVYVDNGYNQLEAMRVVEYAETLDENGITRIPTLVPLNAEPTPSA